MNKKNSGKDQAIVEIIRQGELECILAIAIGTECDGDEIHRAIENRVTTLFKKPGKSAQAPEPINKILPNPQTNGRPI